jgi:short-subunit dehydrogenase involved in D-alanine esterification of teichoic acids
MDKVASAPGGNERIYAAAVDVYGSGRDQAFIAEVNERFGNLHGLINCAGIKGIGNVLDCGEENWKKGPVLYACRPNL